MFRSTYPAIQELFHARHPSIPFFAASFLGLLFILLPAMLRRRNRLPVNGRVSAPLNLLLTTSWCLSQEEVKALVKQWELNLLRKARMSFSWHGMSTNSNLQCRKLRYYSPLSKGHMIVLKQAARLTSEQKISFVSADLTVAKEAQKVFTSCARVPDIVICCAGKGLLNPQN